ncbi:MAG: type II toxin-antitoxin system VapC family toxin [Sphingomonadales bacterium]
MIVIDSSALVAIALSEPECDEFIDILIAAEELLISSVSVVEARMVMHGRKGQQGTIRLNDILRIYDFKVRAPGVAEADLASEAFVKYGKGSGHPAQLNLGDLFSYALARNVDAPLLYKGGDFARTDVISAR